MTERSGLNNMSEAEHSKWVQGWSDFMVKMWQERQKRDWFSKKYMYSLHRLNEFEAAYYGQTYQGLVSSFLWQLFGGGQNTIDRSVSQL